MTLDDILIRIVGDPSQYLRSIQQSVGATQQMSSAVAAASSTIKGAQSALTGFAGSAAAALGFLGLSSSLSSALTKFTEMERGLIRLDAAIGINGGNVKAVHDDYLAFAKSIEEQTLMTKGSVIGLLEQAEAMGFTGEAAKRVALNAIAMAKGNSDAASGMLRITAAMEQGNVQLLRRIPGLRGIKSETELLARAQKLLTSGFAIARAEANSTGGQIERLGRSFAGFTKEVGGVVAEAILPVVEALRDAVDWFNALDPAIRRGAVAVAAVFGAVLAAGPALMLLGKFAALFSPLGIALAAAAVAVTVWVQSVGGIGKAWEIVKETVMPILERIGEALVYARDVTIEFVVANRDLIVTAGLVAGAIGTVYGAYRLLIFAVLTTNALLTVLGIKQVIVTAALLAWKIATIAMTAVQVLFNINFAIFHGLMTGALILWAGYTPLILVAKAATWLFNTALTVTNALLLGAGILAAAVTFAAIGAALVVAAAAAYGVYSAVQGVIEILTLLPQTSGPVAKVTALLGEWWGIMKDVGRAARVDLKLAWELLAAGFKLAVEQVRALFPPLWVFIRTGFDVVWSTAIARFEQGFALALARMNQKLGTVFAETFGTEIAELLGIDPEALKKQADKLEATIKELQELQLAEAKAAIEAAVQAFEDATRATTPAVEAARKEVERLRKQLEDLLAAGGKGKGKGKVPDMIPKIKEGAEAATKAIEKFDAALASSAEARTRIEAFADLTARTTSPAGAAVGVQAAAAGSAEAAGRKETLDIWKEIRDAVNTMAGKPPVAFDGAELPPGV